MPYLITQTRLHFKGALTMNHLQTGRTGLIQALLRFFGLLKSNEMHELEEKIKALDKSNAVIEFTMDGTIITANFNFLSLMGYSLNEVKGKHHSMFVDKQEKESAEYQAFWERLKQGEFESREFKRISKDGSEKWIQASYNPVLDNNGIPIKVIKFATDITDKKHENLNFKGQIDAINKSNAVIEFNLDGTIIHANNNFLSLLNYTLEEVVGKHHSMFVEEKDKNSADYKRFWDKLNQGLFEASEFKRLKKDGSEVWIQASYNPIMDSNGKPLKVVKFAVDITQQKELQEKTHRSGIALLESLTELESTVGSQSSAALEQATSVSEIVSIVEEIKSTSQQTLEKASNLGDTAEKTYVEGERGINACEDLYTAMQSSQEKMQEIANTILGLSDKTQQIGEITEAVADIAKQSKMLALNASIEAAKAGESGKGFAVVAGEVKELAERSETSTSRVQKILQDIRKTTEQAVMVSEEGTKSIEENIAHVELTTNIMTALGGVIQESSVASQQIVSAVKEESVGIEQVVQSIQEIDAVTAQFSSATEDTKKAIVTLASLAEDLRS